MVAIDWDVAPDSGSRFEPDSQPPVVLPVHRPRATRRVGVVKGYSPPKAYGLVAGNGRDTDAIFNIDDVAPADRLRLNNGETVTFHVVAGPDGSTAKDVRIDATTLPPLPDATLISKGWR